MMYHSEVFRPLRYDLEGFINASQGPANGTYGVKLYKGNIEIVRRESDTNLFAPEIRSIKAKGFNQQMCRDAAHVRGLPYQVLAMRGRVRWAGERSARQRKGSGSIPGPSFSAGEGGRASSFAWGSPGGPQRGRGGHRGGAARKH